MSFRNEGFSLIEIIVAIAILGIVSAAALSFLANSFELFNSAFDQVETQRDLRHISRYITKELQNSYNVSLYDFISSSEINTKKFDYIYLDQSKKIIHIKQNKIGLIKNKKEIYLDDSYQYNLKFESNGKNSRIVYYFLENTNNNYQIESNIFLQNVDDEIKGVEAGSIIEYEQRE